MTLRLLVLGNSHLAALSDGWRAHPGRWPGLSVRLVGAHDDLLLQTRIEGGHLIPATAAAAEAFRRLGGGEGVDLAEHDAIAIAGCLVGLTSAEAIWAAMRWPGLPSLEREADLATMAPVLVSLPAARAALVARLSQRLGIRLARHLRAGTDLPLWITSQPRTSAAALSRPGGGARILTAVQRAGDAPALSALFDEAAHLAAAAAGAGFVPQPAATIARHILTAPRFMLGANRLAQRPDLPQPPGDVMHANGAWGALMLDALADRLRPAVPAH